jgi:hypothetical protein
MNTCAYGVCETNVRQRCVDQWLTTLEIAKLHEELRKKGVDVVFEDFVDWNFHGTPL